MAAKAKPVAEKALSPARCAVMHAWVIPEVMIMFQAEADQRRIHVDELLRRITTAVAYNQLFGEILDP